MGFIDRIPAYPLAGVSIASVAWVPLVESFSSWAALGLPVLGILLLIPKIILSWKELINKRRASGG